MVPPPLHPLCAPLAGLVGVWRGEGTGVYPTIESFRYGEEIRWAHSGKPFLAYTQRTWALDDQRPLHAEAGYLRPQSDGSAVELVMTMPTGHLELSAGTWDGHRLALASTTVSRTPSAKQVDTVRRTIDLDPDGDTMRYLVEMAAVGQPCQQHLEAVLRRAPDGLATS